MKYHLTLLRHGESEANAQKRLQGRHEAGLTELGREQARRVAERWKAAQVHFDAILSSSLSRARETAEIVAGVLGMQVQIDPIWAERSFGNLENRPYDEIKQLDPPVDYHLPFTPVGESGESQIDLYIRACQALQSLIQRPAGQYLVVSHGAFLGKVLYAILGITPQGHYNSPSFAFGNAAYINLTYDKQLRRWWLLAFNNPYEWWKD